MKKLALISVFFMCFAGAYAQDQNQKIVTKEGVLSLETTTTKITSLKGTKKEIIDMYPEETKNLGMAQPWDDELLVVKRDTRFCDMPMILDLYVLKDGVWVYVCKWAETDGSWNGNGFRPGATSLLKDKHQIYLVIVWLKTGVQEEKWYNY